MNLDRPLLRLLAGNRRNLALAILLGALVGILIVFQALTLSQIVASVLLRHATLDVLWGALWLLLAIFVGRFILAWAQQVVAFRVAAAIKVDIRDRLYRQILARGPSFARGERTGELINTAMEGVEALEPYFSQYLPQLVLAALIPLSILAFVFPLDWLSALVLVLTGPLIPVFMILIGKAAEAMTRKQWRSLSFMSAHFLDVLQGLTTLKILGRSRDEIASIRRVSEDFRDTTMGVLRVAFLSSLALELLATISTAVVAVQVGLRLLYGQIEFEQAFFVLVLAPDYYVPLRLLGTRFHAGMSGVTAARRIFEVLGTEPETRSAVEPLQRNANSIDRMTRPQSMAASKKSAIASPALERIEFRRVGYCYDGTRAALQDVSFAIEPRQRVALVGPTGAGKSTITSLLLRFIEPSEGEINCGGKPLSDWPPEIWRRLVAWVPQRPYLLNDTVAANIGWGRPGASFDDIRRAARIAHADEFVRTLPDGYDTVIGEQGAQVSGGQAQRIALARAFIKDAPLLILDEATANLDVENAALIGDAIDHLMNDRTVLLITHRLNTIASADRIVVIDAGRVVECGTHAALTATPGLYHDLVVAVRAEGG